MNRVAVVSLISIPVIAGAATTAGASTKAGIELSSSGGSASPKTTFDFSGPKSKILGSGKTAVFKPTAITMAEDTSGNNCTPFISEAELANKGTGTAYVTLDGSPFVTLTAHTHTFICAYGYGAGTEFNVGLSNKKDTKAYSAALTITTSD